MRNPNSPQEEYTAASCVDLNTSLDLLLAYEFTLQRPFLADDNICIKAAIISKPYLQKKHY